MTRIWVTGIGALSALGAGADALADALAAGRSGVQARPAEGALPAHAAACVQQPLGQQLPPAQRGLHDRHALLALEAAAEAWAQAGLPATTAQPERAAVVWGSGMGGSASLEAAYGQVFTAQPPRVHPYAVLRIMANAPAAHLAMKHQLQGGLLSVANACASSAQALGEALQWLRSGRADVVLAGGSESLLNAGSVMAWAAMGVMAPLDATEASASCRPFDDARAGLVLGEGAAALVLETEAHARARGARPLAELAGYGHSVDAAHLSRPDAAGQARAMRAALRDAGLQPADIGYVNAHGTATEAGDATEAASIAEVFGVRRVPVSATKALHGHLIGAGGALELVATLQALRRQQLPASCHVRSSRLAEQIDLVLGRPRPQAFSAAMSNSFAFGGSNCCLILKAPHGV